jgi:hypothetical protein
MTIHDLPGAADPNESSRESDRVRRAPPEREAPLRHAAYAFRAGAASPAKPTSPSPSTSTSVPPSAAPARSVVEQAVETAYRVFDDYVAWGQQTAAQRPVTSLAFAGSDWSTMMGPKMPMSALTAPWLQPWQDMYRVWFDAVTPLLSNLPALAPFMPGAGAPRGRAPEAPSAPPVPTVTNVGRALELELDVSQRVRVSLHLLNKPAEGALRAALHREEGEGRLLLEFEASALRIKLGDEQAPGTYSGIVRDLRGEQVGILTVQVFAAPGKRS